MLTTTISNAIGFRLPQLVWGRAGGTSMQYDQRRHGWVIRRTTRWQALVGVRTGFVDGKFTITNHGRKRRVPMPRYWPSITVNHDLGPDDDEAARAWMDQVRNRRRPNVEANPHVNSRSTRRKGTVRP